MLDSIEALSKYKVSLGTEDQFAHIMNFVKNMELKDSKLYEKNENLLSKTFGNYLLKYFDHNLTVNDINNLITLVNEYNDHIDSQLTNDEYLYQLYGLADGFDFNKSIIYKLSEALLSNLIKRYYENEIKIVPFNGVFKNYNNLSAEDKTTYDNAYNAATVGLSEEELADYIKENITNPVEELIGNTYKYKLPLAYYIITEILDIEPTTSGLNPVIKDLNKDENYDIDNIINLIQTSNLEDFFRVYKKKDKIFILKTSGSNVKNQESKYSASNTEIKYANNGELPIFFDLIISNENDTNDTGNTNELFGYNEYFIYYKEFNSEYRKLLDADTTDLLIHLNKNGKFENYIKSYQYDNSNINIFKYFRNYNNDFLYAYDIYDTDKNIIGTNKLFKYQYCNPYLARRAAENEIVKYYVADPYISDKYGLLEYQKFEIQNFLNIYRSVREYYYKVLLNESFINDEKYPFIEKFFLIFWSVEKFLSSKVDNLKNIDSYDLTDIKNFLKSFGFKKLSDIIDENVFYNSETYAAALVKNYKNLINYKGSKKVIDILEKIFSMDDTTLTIYKYLLVKEYEGSEHKYKFVKTDYYSTNVFEEITSNLSLGTDLVDHVKEDPYWDANNTKTEDLDNLNINIANTKYLAPELSMNVAKNYIRTRCILALIEYVFDKFTSIHRSTGLIITSSTLNAEFEYNEFLKIIKYLLQVYALQDEDLLANYKIAGIYNNDYKTYKINESNLNTALSTLYNNYNPDNGRYRRYTKNTAIADMVESALNAFRSLSYISKLDASNADEVLKDLQKIYVGNAESVEGIGLVFKNIIDDFEIYFNLILNDFYLYQLSYEDYKLLFNDLFDIFFDKETSKDCMCPYFVTVSGNRTHPYKEYSIEEVKDCSDLISALDVDGTNAGEYITKLCNELSIAIDSSFIITTESNENATLLFLEEVIKFFISYSAEIYKFQFSKDYNTKMENCIPRDTYKLDISYNLSDSMYYDEEVTVQEILEENGGNDGNI